MTYIKITNPYFDKEMVVHETIKDIERQLEHVELGYKECITVHTKFNEIVWINPRNLASCEMREEEK